MTALKKEKTTNEEKRKKLTLQKRYAGRITVAKIGREAFLARDFVTATRKYNEYLGIIADIQEKSSIFHLAPEKFDKTREVTEMLFISQIYWELARVYEMTPKLQEGFHKSLDQFVRFTINQPYQVLNAEMLRKYIKKNKYRSKQIVALEKAYAKIFVQSKKCFIATHTFGENHPITNELRHFKAWLLSKKYGQHLVASYYRFSSPLVDFLDQSPKFSLFFKFVTAPLLFTFSKLIKPFII